MTVAVSLNLSDGVILGVDSAVTLPAPGGVVKVYEHAEKLFQLVEKPVGIAIFGLGNIRARSIGSYLREFEVRDPNGVVTQPVTVERIVEELRNFFYNIYITTIIPDYESQTGKKFESLPDEQKPILGLTVGGFSADEYLSEVWVILIPIHERLGSAVRCREEGNFGSNWFAAFGPIIRYVKGFDPNLLEELKNYFMGLRGSPFNADENSKLEDIVRKYEYPIPFVAMPIEEGIAHVRFLVELTINHHRFAAGAPIVGGKAKIGLVTYKGEKFRILGGE